MYPPAFVCLRVVFLHLHLYSPWLLSACGQGCNVSFGFCSPPRGARNKLQERGQEQNAYGHVYVCVSSFFLLMAILFTPSDAICDLSVEDKPVYSIANIGMMAFAPWSVEGIQRLLFSPGPASTYIIRCMSTTTVVSTQPSEILCHASLSFEGGSGKRFQA